MTPNKLTTRECHGESASQPTSLVPPKTVGLQVPFCILRFLNNVYVYVGDCYCCPSLQALGCSSTFPFIIVGPQQSQIPPDEGHNRRRAATFLALWSSVHSQHQRRPPNPEMVLCGWNVRRRLNWGFPGKANAIIPILEFASSILNPINYFSRPNLSIKLIS